MEHTAAQQAQQKLEDVMQKTMATTGGAEGGTEGGTLPSNVEIEEKMQALKMDVPREHLSDKGQEVAEKVDKLVEDTRRLFLEKNKDEDLQKAALHASRAAQIARRNELLNTPEGRRALEEAKEGAYSAIGFARLLVTSAEFRDELIDSLGLVQQALRRRPVGGTTTEGRTEEVKEGGVGRPVEEEEEEEGEEEEFFEGGTQEEGLMQKKATPTQPLSQNQIDQVAHRFVRLLKRVQTKPEFRDSFRFLLQRLRGALEMGSLHAERMEQELAETQAGRSFLAETQQAKDHAIRLIENWTEASLDPLFHQLNALNEQMQQDRETRAELRGLGDLAETNLTSGQMGNEDAVVQEAKERFARVRERLLTNYDDRIRRLLDELAYVRDTFRENEAAEILQRDAQELARTLIYDEQGQPTINVGLVKDLEVLFSALLRKVQFVPVPRIAVVTKDFDFAADDIVLNIRELTPKQIHLETITNVHDPELERAKQSARESTTPSKGQGTPTPTAGPTTSETTRGTTTEHGIMSTTTMTTTTTTGGTVAPVGAATTSSQEPISLETFVRIHLREVHSDLRGVSWYFNKKTGMMQEHDRGLADIKIYGKGMSIDVDVSPGLPVPTEEHPVAHALEVKQVKCKIHRMSLRLYDAKHDWLYTLFHPFIKAQVRRAIESAVEQYLTEYIADLDKNATIAAVGHYPATRPIKTIGKEQQQGEQRQEQQRLEQQRQKEQQQRQQEQQTAAAHPIKTAPGVGARGVATEFSQQQPVVEEEGFEKPGGRLAPVEEGPA